MRDETRDLTPQTNCDNKASRFSRTVRLVAAMSHETNERRTAHEIGTHDHRSADQRGP